MPERIQRPYVRAGRLIRLASELQTFCLEHDQRDLAGGLRWDELATVERQLAAAMQWVRQLGTGRAANARAAERVPAERVPVDDECF